MNRQKKQSSSNIFARALVHCLGAHRGHFDWSDPQLELAL